MDFLFYAKTTIQQWGDAKTQFASVDFKFKSVKTEDMDICKEPSDLSNFFHQFSVWMPLKKKYAELNFFAHPSPSRHFFFLQVSMSLLPGFTYMMMKG